MKITIITLLFLFFAACGSKPPQVTLPEGTDLKTAIRITKVPEGKKVEVTFFYNKPVAPGVKTVDAVTNVPVEDARLNDEPLTASVNEAGLTVYNLMNVATKAENIITAKLNNKLYEAKLLPQTTLEDKSVTAVMVPK